MSAAKAPPPLEVGDVAPRFVLPRAAGGPPYDSESDSIIGRVQVLAFGQGPASAGPARLIARASELAALGCVPLVVIRRGQEGARPDIAVDADGRMTAHFGGPDGVVVIGRNGHALVVDRIGGAAAVDRAAELLRGLAADWRPKPAERQAPVLMVPNAMSRADCRRLIDVYNAAGAPIVEPGHGVQNQKSDYKMRIPDYGRKDRIDHWIVNPETMAFVNDRLQRRVFPEIRKAFQYKITRHERYRIGCYEGERGGMAHGHRDNTQPNVAHRRFACSINLNAEDFEGGELVFPEYGDQRFSPATGEAVVFSSSMLHEPLHVTAGRRMVLLAFLFGEV